VRGARAVHGPRSTPCAGIDADDADAGAVDRIIHNFSPGGRTDIVLD